MVKLFRSGAPTTARRSIRDDAGAAMVEFALVLPLLLFLMFGIVEFGRGWNVQQVLTDAAREGARVAVVSNRNLSQQALQDSVGRTIARRLQSASLNAASTNLTMTGVGGVVGTPATVAINYNHPLLFGSFVLRRNEITLRSTFAMRNE